MNRDNTDRNTNSIPFTPNATPNASPNADANADANANANASIALSSSCNPRTTGLAWTRTGLDSGCRVNIGRMSRWLLAVAILVAAGSASQSAQAQSARARAHNAHHRLHHHHQQHHAIHAGHPHAFVVRAHHVATTPIVATKVVPTVQQIQVAYPLNLRFHHLVIQQKLPARIVWNNGRYWIWYGGQWCEYGWFVRTQVGGNWNWYLSRYRQKYGVVLQNCLP